MASSKDIAIIKAREEHGEKKVLRLLKKINKALGKW